MTQTLGESRVRTGFNPDERADVQQFKDLTAALIDKVNAIPASDGEVGRLKALAMTDLESAAMWAVKAMTAPIGAD